VIKTAEQKQIEKKVSVIRNTSLIGELVDITLPVPTVSEQDATTWDSPDMIEQAIAGWIKLGEAKFTMNYLPITTHDDLLEDVYDRATDLWTFVFPTSGRAIQFSGFIKSPEEKVPLKDGHQVTVSISVQTKPVRLKTVSAGLTTPFISFKNQADESITNFTPATPAAAYDDYSVICFSDDTGIKITPTAAAGTIYVNDVQVTSGAASSAITIATTSGPVTNIPIVVWESGKSPKVYWVRAVKGAVASPT